MSPDCPVSGALGAVATGGDVGMSAAIGGVSAGFGEWVGSAFPIEGSGIGAWAAKGFQRTAVGAILGGGVAAIMGGSFGRGAALGAQSAAIGYVSNKLVHEGMEKARIKIIQARETLRTGNIRIERRKVSTFWGDLIDGLNMAIGLYNNNVDGETVMPTPTRYSITTYEEWALYNTVTEVDLDTGFRTVVIKSKVYGSEHEAIHSVRYEDRVEMPGNLGRLYRALKYD